MKQLRSGSLLITSIGLLNLFTLQMAACQQPAKKVNTKVKTSTATATGFTAGKDYVEYRWARLWDKKGFEKPVEAFSMLLPAGWTHEGQIMWNPPGADCAGTNSWFKARSADGRYSLEMLPNVLWVWSNNPQMQQFRQNSGASACQPFRQPVNAEGYLNQVLAPALGNARIVKINPNQQVTALMQQRNDEGRQELMSYGAADVRYQQSALTADVKWADGNEGVVMLGVSIIETIVPNNYTGTYDTQYTTSIVNQIVYRYPAGQSAAAKNQLTAIVGSMRTNPVWKNSLDRFWKDVRRQRHVAHVGKIALMDQQTAQMGKDAIRKGQATLNQMDANMRSWEAKQSSQDRMHTNFIKTIREVENYRDENGKVELSSGYNHAWSRSDGSSFILTDNPNFDPSSVMQDQRWKEMQKVD